MVYANKVSAFALRCCRETQGKYYYQGRDHCRVTDGGEERDVVVYIPATKPI
jgi:hypothetical protein